MTLTLLLTALVDVDAGWPGLAIESTGEQLKGLPLARAEELGSSFITTLLLLRLA